jgi:hypothetical protein
VSSCFLPINNVGRQTFNSTVYKVNLDRAVPRRYDYTKVLESGEWAEWQWKFRQELRDLSGLASITTQNEELPLNRRADGVEHFPTYTREKWYIQSEPGIQR